MDIRFASLSALLCAPLFYVAAIATLLVAAPISAATLYEGGRIDYRTGKQDLETRVTASRDAIRADVLANDQLQVSVIESKDRVVIVNHVARSYVAFRMSRSAKPSSAKWRMTSRRRFSLGAYCKIVELTFSETLSQERCVINAGDIAGNNRSNGEDAVVSGTTRIGEFLAIVAQHADVTNLFDRAVETMTNSGSTDVFPLAIRNFSAGVATNELHLVRATRAALARDAFEIPAGFQDAIDRNAITKQAAR